LLGKPDTDHTRFHPVHGKGATIESPTGAQLYVERSGDASKPTLVLTHGWGLDSTIWAYAKRDLGERFNLVVWDLPGTGKSRPGANKQLNPDRFADDLVAVIQSVPAGRVVLVGHSIGGMTIQAFVRRAPQRLKGRVAGIALLNTTYTNPLETMIASGFFKAIRWPVIEPMLLLTRLLQPLAWLEAWRSYASGWAHLANRVQFGKTVTRSQLNAVTLLGTRNSPAALARGNLGMFRWDASSVLADAHCPVLIIAGQNDIVTKPQASREMAADARTRVVLVDDVNHNGFLEDADAYNAAIAAFAEAAFLKARNAETVSAAEHLSPAKPDSLSLPARPVSRT
jgi:pimeloyl-ACP methyl ester carboxylesterase